jgi:hypothetical protein
MGIILKLTLRKIGWEDAGWIHVDEVGRMAEGSCNKKVKQSHYRP